LKELSINNDSLTDLSILQSITNLETVNCFGINNLPRRYWTKLSEWKPEWLLDENNAEIRSTLVEHIGYEKIIEGISFTLDIWRGYTLLRIDDRIEAIYGDGESIEREPMLLLKMTCPSTAHIHILRVPPDLKSAEAAITWINHGIHPDEFTIQT
jgi:leucine-rich repeat protein SHOC2